MERSVLIDKIRVNVAAGKGGDGAIAFESGGKPSGPKGSKGGDVLVEGTRNLFDLKAIKEQFEFKAEDGKVGSSNKLAKNGEDLVIKVPLTTLIYDINNNLLHRIDQDGQRVLLAKGGRGGLGNHYFRRGQAKTRRKFTKGDPGQDFKLFFELQLEADIVFIGLPNAGKSSMLNALTNANAKVASYPFTTLTPNLGIIDGMTLMDLPGLIEGASEGKGLGSRFKKHTRKAKLVMHFVALDSLERIQNYQLMRKEIEDIDTDLAALPELLVLTKADNVDNNSIKEAIKEFSQITDSQIVVTSIVDQTTIENLYKQILKIFDDIRTKELDDENGSM